MSHFQRHRGSGPPSGAHGVGSLGNLANRSPSSFAPWTGAFLLFRRVLAPQQKPLGSGGEGVIETSGSPAARNPILFSDCGGSGAQRRRVTCPRPHSKAISEPRLPNVQIRVPLATLAACPTRPGPEARTSGTAAPLLSRACTRAGGGGAGRDPDGGRGGHCPSPDSRGRGGGAKRRRRVSRPWRGVCVWGGGGG